MGISTETFSFSGRKGQLSSQLIVSKQFYDVMKPVIQKCSMIGECHHDVSEYNTYVT